MTKNYDSDNIVKNFINCLDYYNQIEIVFGALNILPILVRNSKTFFTIKSNVKVCIKKISKIISISDNNTEIILPALNILLALRDKNYDDTISSIITLPEDQLEQIQELTHQCANKSQRKANSSQNDQEEENIRPINDPANVVKVSLKKDLNINSDKEEIIIKAVFPKDNSLNQENETKEELQIKKLILKESLSTEELEQLLDRIIGIVSNPYNESFWKAMGLKIINLLLTTIASNEQFQFKGFKTLKAVIGQKSKLLYPYINDIIASIVQCYSLSRRIWEDLNDICCTISTSFSTQQIIAILTKNIIVKDSPILQCYIRCLTAIITNSKNIVSSSKEIAESLYKVIDMLI